MSAICESTDLQDDVFIRQLASCHNPLRAFIFTLLGNSASVDDVLQDTHVEMWQQKAKFVDGTNFFAWACSIAHFKVLKHRNSQARERLVFDDRVLEQLAERTAGFQERFSERSSALEDCLERLPPSQRELVHQRYVGKTTTDELAASLKRSSAGLRVTLTRIRKALVDCIERKLAAGSRP